MSIARLRLVVPLAALVLVLLAPASAFASRDASGNIITEPDPVLVLQSYKTNPGYLSVGSRFKLEVSIDNVVDVQARNVVVTVAGSAMATSGIVPPTNSPQVVVLGSSTRYLGTVDGNEKNRRVTFDLISNPKGGPGPFTLPVTVEYDSNNGGRGVVTQAVGLMLTRTLVFDVGALTYPTETTAGVPFKTSVAVQNTNEFPVNGVALSFTGAGVTWSSNETTVGTLDPGKTGRLEATGIPEQAGNLLVTMVITYKDDYNQVKEIRRDLTIAVAARPVEKPRPVSNRPTTTGGLVALFVKALLGLGG
jgi:hypothetical protein